MINEESNNEEKMKRVKKRSESTKNQIWKMKVMRVQINSRNRGKKQINERENGIKVKRIKKGQRDKKLRAKWVLLYGQLSNARWITVILVEHTVFRFSACNCIQCVCVLSYISFSTWLIIHSFPASGTKMRETNKKRTVRNLNIDCLHWLWVHFYAFTDNTLLFLLLQLRHWCCYRPFEIRDQQAEVFICNIEKHI